MVQTASTVVLAALESSTISSEEAAFFSAHPVSGVTLFARNIPDDYRQLSKLTNSLQQLRPQADPALMVAIDQEGGRVRRIKDPGFPNHGPAQQLAGGSADGEALKDIAIYGNDLGAALKELGVNVNFAPVADILTRADNEAIGDRVFGTEPDIATLRAGAFMDGMQAAGVHGCLKHFPGQGDAPADTHLQSATVDVTKEVLQQRELKPFRDLLPKTQMVMISHCIYLAYDSKPAGISKVIIEDLLRKEMGFTGLVVSDDLLMEAVPQQEANWQASLIDSVLAGVDLLLVCKSLDRMELAVKTLADEAAKSKTFNERLKKAAERVLTMRRLLS